MANTSSFCQYLRDVFFESILNRAKRFLNEKYEAWYSVEITKRLNEGSDVYAIDIDLNLSVMKPIHARWLISFYDHMQNQVNLIKQSFYVADIYDAITMPLLT